MFLDVEDEDDDENIFVVNNLICVLIMDVWVDSSWSGIALAWVQRLASHCATFS